MKAILEKTWVRLLAMILFFLLSAGAALSLHLYNFALMDGWYRDDDSYTFADSNMAQAYVYDALAYVSRNLNWLKDPYNTTLGGYGGDAFSYVIEGYYDPEVVYADTTDESSHYVAEINCPVSIQDIEHIYRLKGYVNLPVHPYGGCYREYYVFEHLFPLRGYYLPVGIVLTVLCVALLAVVLSSALLAGKKGSSPTLGRFPFDGALAALYIILILTENLVYNSLDESITDILIQVGLYHGHFHTVCMIWYGALMGMLLAYQLAARCLTKRLLLRKAVRKLPFGLLMGIITALHILTLLLMLAPYYGWGIVINNYHDQNYYLIFWLIGFDAAAAVCLIRYNRERKLVCQASNALTQGELNYKINTERLHLVWHTLGQDLNCIGDGMAAAVEERMRSERMKTELITNVSHDLKTPLTSIINYIALLKEKDLPPETQREYLDVLDRQSAKLKKLTEDVVEASKAASGVMPVHPELLDVTELLTQSVGEYAERLEEAGILPVIHTPETESYIMADGRLLGRVLDNFITNIIKYAQPGTRAYFDLTAGQTDTVIAVKNTSQAPLDIPEEELMERFVRGDSSRSTEGSGLGLSIARSLTELMGGQMHLTLDGDLFKAEVTFPTVPSPVPKEPEPPQLPEGRESLPAAEA